MTAAKPFLETFRSNFIFPSSVIPFELKFVFFYLPHMMIFQKKRNAYPPVPSIPRFPFLTAKRQRKNPLIWIEPRFFFFFFFFFFNFNIRLLIQKEKFVESPFLVYISVTKIWLNIVLSYLFAISKWKIK